MNAQQKTHTIAHPINRDVLEELIAHYGTGEKLAAAIGITGRQMSTYRTRLAAPTSRVRMLELLHAHLKLVDAVSRSYSVARADNASDVSS